MWVVALLAAGLQWRWPAALILAKPTVAPLAFVGTTRRSWWAAIGAMALISVPLLPLWDQWIAVVRHSPPGIGLTYNSPDLAGLVAMVVGAWAVPRIVARLASSPTSTIGADPSSV
jgi:hypothetical protein